MVVVRINGDVKASTEVTADSAEAQYDLTFGFDGNYTPNGTGTVVIAMEGFGLPESFPARSVSMWIEADSVIKPGSLVVRPDPSDMTVNAAAGTVTIPLPIFTDAVSADEALVLDDEVVHVRFAESAGITAPSDATTDQVDPADTVVGLEYRVFQWEVDGAPGADVLRIAAKYEAAPPPGKR